MRTGPAPDGKPPEPADSAGRGDISARQQLILEHLQQGRSDKEIAYRMQLSTHGVDYHMRQLRRRYGARNRVQLVNASMTPQRVPSKDPEDCEPAPA
jgi:DNA-binding NarL/FixJ family response regulator